MEAKRKKAILGTVLPPVLIPAGLVFIRFYRMTLSRFILPCPIRMILGIYCPGCGGTHCVYALSEGNIPEALRYNAFFFTVAAAAVLLWAECIAKAFGKELHILPRSSRFYTAAGIVFAVYFVLRNIIPQLAPV